MDCDFRFPEKWVKEYSRAPELWACAVYVSELTVGLVRNATEEECLVLSVERPVVHSENLA